MAINEVSEGKHGFRRQGGIWLRDKDIAQPMSRGSIILATFAASSTCWRSPAIAATGAGGLVLSG
jgi:hypothetical protein